MQLLTSVALLKSSIVNDSSEIDILPSYNISRAIFLVIPVKINLDSNFCIIKFTEITIQTG
ncbi:MAG: hypothetical protein ACQESO_04340 [Bacillota bacterium]